jgi:hypothetical protein
MSLEKANGDKQEKRKGGYQVVLSESGIEKIHHGPIRSKRVGNQLELT